MHTKRGWFLTPGQARRQAVANLGRHKSDLALASMHLHNEWNRGTKEGSNESQTEINCLNKINPLAEATCLPHRPRRSNGAFESRKRF